MKILQIGFTVIVLAMCCGAAAQSKDPDIDWKPELARGGAPPCPKHPGVRTSRSETILVHQSKVLIIGTTTKIAGKDCVYEAKLQISGEHARVISFAHPEKNSFAVVDASPNGEKLLLEDDIWRDPPDIDKRNVEVAVFDLRSGSYQWQNVWDIFGWGDCSATVEPQGFTNGGRLLISARHSTWAGSEFTPCVQRPGLYEMNADSRMERLPDDTKVVRFAQEVADASEPCKEDPDIVSACFIARGRMSLYNGSHNVRIWRTGTHRMLGADDDMPLPALLQDKLNWDVAIWGDFNVCPLTKERPGEMQFVCVESANHIHLKPW